MSRLADYIEPEGLTIIVPEGNCSRCKNTKEWGSKLGVVFDHTITVREDDEEIRDTLKSLGFHSFPIVTTGDETHQWCGFDPQKLKAYAQLHVKKS